MINILAFGEQDLKKPSIPIISNTMISNESKQENIIQYMASFTKNS